MTTTLPTGTLTFLFSDIEGSTARWEQQREAMSAALMRHDEILRSCIEAHGGHVFKTVGDGHPGGEYPLGDDEVFQIPDQGGYTPTSAHVPRRRVEVAAFEIGQFTVTNAEYACFLAAGGYEDERW